MAEVPPSFRVGASEQIMQLAEQHAVRLVPDLINLETLGMELQTAVPKDPLIILVGHDELPPAPSFNVPGHILLPADDFRLGDNEIVVKLNGTDGFNESNVTTSIAQVLWERKRAEQDRAFRNAAFGLLAVGMVGIVGGEAGLHHPLVRNLGITSLAIGAALLFYTERPLESVPKLENPRPPIHLVPSAHL